MNIEPTVPTTKNPAAQFAGDVWLDPIALPHEPDQTMVVATVRFAPGARTAWHSHEHGQYLRVTQGVGRFGTRDGKIVEVRPESAAARCSSRRRSTSRMSWAQLPCQVMRVGIVGDNSEALAPGAAAMSRAAVWIRAEPCTGICNRKKRSRQPGSIDTDPP